MTICEPEARGWPVFTENVPTTSDAARAQPCKCAQHSNAVPTCSGPRSKTWASTWLGSPRTTTTVAAAAAPAIPRRPSRASSAPTTTTDAAIIAGTRNKSMSRTPVTSSTSM